MYTGPQSHYTERTINKREPEWLHEFRKEHLGQRKMYSDLRLFAKEFGQGMRKQRDKTKEKAGTLPLTLRMIRRVRK